MMFDHGSAAFVAGQTAQLVKVRLGKHTGIASFPVAAHADDMIGMRAKDIKHSGYTLAFEIWLIGYLIEDPVAVIFQRLGPELDTVAETPLGMMIDNRLIAESFGESGNAVILCDDHGAEKLFCGNGFKGAFYHGFPVDSCQELVFFEARRVSGGKDHTADFKLMVGFQITTSFDKIILPYDSY